MTRVGRKLTIGPGSGCASSTRSSSHQVPEVAAHGLLAPAHFLSFRTVRYDSVAAGSHASDDSRLASRNAKREHGYRTNRFEFLRVGNPELPPSGSRTNAAVTNMNGRSNRVA